MGNPLVPQGLLNRARASVQWTLFPDLNVTAPYLGRNGVSLGFNEDVTAFLKTMTGVVQSQEITVDITLTLHLLRTQNFADLYKRKMETNSNFGAGSVRPDVTSNGIGQYLIYNCGIKNVGPMTFAGTEESYTVTIGGSYNVNSELFNF